VRPDVGSGLFILTILAGIMLTFQKGIRNEIKVFFCSFATLFGAIPLFLNNYGLTGNVLTTPLAIKYQAISDSSVEVLNEMLATNYYAGFPSILDLPVALYHVLFDPVYPFTAGFFQVSPVSFLAVFCIGYLVYHVTIKKQFFDSEYEKMTFFGILFIAIGLILPQLNNVIQLGESRGIVPDIRYLSLLYFPLIILGLFFLKRLEFHEQDLKKTLESFFLIGIVTLPLSFIAIQADSQVSIGLNRMVQMQIVGWISYVLLGFVVVCIVLIMAKKDRQGVPSLHPPSPLYCKLHLVYHRWISICIHVVGTL